MSKNKTLQILEGSHAIALTIKNIAPAVISAYPITPQTHIVEDLAKFKAEGLANYEYVRAESEFAAASIILGASASGVRTYSATSSQGLLLMTEVVFNMAGLRLPIVMTCANRAVSAPINIWCFRDDTKILMADLSYKNINKIKIGDSVLGKDRAGNLVYTKVTKLFSRYTDDLVRLKTTETEIYCTPEHKFYYHSGHNHWTKAENLKGKKLHNFGYPDKINDNFKKGWLTGVADGDGSFYHQENRYYFRLKCKDQEMAETFTNWANHFKYPLRNVDYLKNDGYFISILTNTEKTKHLKKFLTRKHNPDFARGYLAGIYDAEGSGPFKVKQAVIYNNNLEIIKAVESYLELIKIKFKTYIDTRRGGQHKNDNYHVKINNVPEFFIKCPPRISRKRDNLLRMTLKSVKSRSGVLEITPVEVKTKVYNIETTANNYIANGFLVHNCDHQDVMVIRDSGWILLFAENHQEAISQHIMAYKIAEATKIPVMVNVDGYIITHSYEPAWIPDKATIQKYLGKYQPAIGTYLNPKKPITIGAFAPPDHYMEIRQELHEDLVASQKVINAEYFNYQKMFETETKKNKLEDNGLLEYSGPQKPQAILVTMGSVLGTIRTVIKENNLEKKIGILKIRTYRPFPKEAIAKVILRTTKIAVIEKALSLGQEGPLTSDIKSLLSDKKSKVNVQNYIVGLGGRDISRGVIKKIINDTMKAVQKPQSKFINN
ncbi:hypothetical protein COT98_01740 [Candidatus Falkowbacteria bacterium CG10_big_fil_rev_8_21_14_0_10_39_9]|uniref:Uncharacterized protein n=1 Tax=Candidatus Falkowbacteria bacterium CG10_big_fil_rev_8_21_14_0_10_39_9 TaxID=1974566 RepID=A0A2M6WQ69_9BACT|nr:MAG: hypothetical protein COT98_01740 [Candidatus Falkowbacteria bacterium CG10_big_fil_rev_8_21_14_0_10_39_9]